MSRFFAVLLLTRGMNYGGATPKEVSRTECPRGIVPLSTLLHTAHDALLRTLVRPGWGRAYHRFRD